LLHRKSFSCAFFALPLFLPLGGTGMPCSQGDACLWNSTCTVKCRRWCFKGRGAPQ
jgi:hypothetical protein